jgi:hypothetical protein
MVRRRASGTCRKASCSRCAAGKPASLGSAASFACACASTARHNGHFLVGLHAGFPTATVGCGVTGKGCRNNWLLACILVRLIRLRSTSSSAGAATRPSQALRPGSRLCFGLSPIWWDGRRSTATCADSYSLLFMQVTRPAVSSQICLPPGAVLPTSAHSGQAGMQLPVLTSVGS